ncbi:MAG: hypothetical protein K2X27_25610 [Candidatus Obscuribacterales bacterium]|nr:hypothetical protein [Candidatus Obscuribacterales bacterium]
MEELRMQQYVVLTGIVRFEIYSFSPYHAIQELKQRIDARRHQRKNPEIGMSLVEALDEGRLNFLALDKQGFPLAGECGGIPQDPPQPALILQFERNLQLYVTQRAKAALHNGRDSIN